MYKRNLICLIILLNVFFCVGCNDAEENKDENIPTARKGDSLKTDPYLLSAVELSDDTVFSDGSRPVSWQNAGVTDPLAMKTFIRKLQVWARDNHVDSISSY